MRSATCLVGQDCALCPGCHHFVLALGAYAKALVPDLPGPRAYWWIINYEDGLIRRGLLGTLLTPVRNSFSNQEEYRSAITIFYHVTALLTLLAILFWGLNKVIAAKDCNLQVVGAATIMLFAASPFVSNQAYNSGWLDVYLMGVGTLCFVLVRNGRYGMAAAIAFFMVFIHELSLFFWLPSAALILLHLLKRYPRPNLVLCLTAMVLPVIAAATIGRFETWHAVEAAIQAMAIDDYMKNMLLREQFVHTTLSVLQTQIRLTADYWRNYLWSSIYALLPSIIAIIVALVFSPQRGALAKLLLAGIGLSVWLALPVNWDLSRSMAWTGMSAILLLVEVASPSTNFEETSSEAALG